jgi:hypothetical protein
LPSPSMHFSTAKSRIFPEETVFAADPISRL